MENLFINAAIVSVIFLLIKFGEMRIIKKENKPLKELVRDAFIVYFSHQRPIEGWTTTMLVISASFSGLFFIKIGLYFLLNNLKSSVK